MGSRNKSLCVQGEISFSLSPLQSCISLILYDEYIITVFINYDNETYVYQREQDLMYVLYGPHTVFEFIGILVSFACENFSSINKAGDTNTVPSLSHVS